MYDFRSKMATGSSPSKNRAKEKHCSSDIPRAHTAVARDAQMKALKCIRMGFQFFAMFFDISLVVDFVFLWQECDPSEKCFSADLCTKQYMGYGAFGILSRGRN